MSRREPGTNHVPPTGETVAREYGAALRASGAPRHSGSRGSPRPRSAADEHAGKVCERDFERQRRINALLQSLLKAAPLDRKLQLVVETVVEVFAGELCEIWIARRRGEGSANTDDAASGWESRTNSRIETSLARVAASGRAVEARCESPARSTLNRRLFEQIGRGFDRSLLVNDLTNYPGFAAACGSRKSRPTCFAAYRLSNSTGEPIGVLSLFSKCALTARDDAELGGLADATESLLQSQCLAEVPQWIERRTPCVTCPIRRRAERLEWFESLSRLAGGIAHEFNNLLTGILGNAALVLRRLPAGASVRPELERIIDSTNRATRLTAQIQAYSGTATYNIAPLDLNALAREVIAAVEFTSSASLTVKTELSANLPRIEADGEQLRLVINNLLRNARDAIGDRAGTITISTNVCRIDADRIARDYADQQLLPGYYVRLDVSDTGCGMSPEMLSRIFDPFFSTKFTGCGLGLAAIANVVRVHRGGIRVGTTVDKGTVFTVLFPASGGPGARNEMNAASSIGLTGRSVLVVDDEEVIREIVEAALLEQEAKVLLAEDGARGIELFEQYADEIDLVLLDMTMPGVGGEVVLESIRSIRPDVPVVITSGFSERESRERLAGCPPAAFVQKPFTFEQLIDKLAGALSADRT